MAVPQYVSLGLSAAQVTSFGGNNIIPSYIHQRYRSSYLPIYPADPDASSSNEVLRLENGVRMRKNSYVNTRGNYQIPLAVLVEYDRNLHASSHCLTYKSLEVVRAACGLPSLRSHDRTQRPAEIIAMPDLLQVTPTPPTRIQSYTHVQRQVTSNTIGGIPRPSGIPAPEQEPLLLAALEARRSQAYRVEVRSLRQSERQEYHQHLRMQRNQMNDARDMRAYWTILRAVLVCILLCMGILLLAVLGYGIFVSILWLAHSFKVLLITIQADIVAAGHHIAGACSTVASPFIAVGKGIAACGKAVPHLADAVVRWIRDLRSHV
jgi:hypothetical protein